MERIAREALGLGLRSAHYGALAARGSAGVDFFEAIAENHLEGAALPRHHLLRAREHAPVVLHGVGLDLLGPDPLDRDHLRRLRALADQLDAPCVTDHLCWTAARGRRSHDLLPVPLTPQVVRYAIARVRVVQDALERPFGVENLAAMLGTTQDVLTESEVLAEVAAEADCGLLLDVNNVWVTAQNRGLDPAALLAHVDPARILYAHVAGQHLPESGPIVDTHDAPVRADVWALYAHAWARLGPFPTLLEWDAAVPAYEVCVAELRRALVVRGAAPVRAVPRAARPPVRGAPEPTPPADLVRWQHGLQDLLTQPLLWAPPRVRVDAAAWPAELVAQVRDEAGIGAEARLRAYHEQGAFRLLTALQADFPTLAALMGLWSFNRLASAHLVRHPPRHHDLGRVGDALGDTLRTSPWHAPALEEALAVDEAWRALLALPATPRWTPPASSDALAQVRLCLAPTCRRLDLTWPLPPLRDVVVGRRSEGAVACPPPEPATWLVVRIPDLAIGHLRLPPLEAELLTLFAAHPLQEALARLEAAHADVGPALGPTVQRTLALGVHQGWWSPA